MCYFLATTKPRAETVCPSGLSTSGAGAMASEARLAQLLVYLDEHRAELEALQCNDMRELLRTGEARQGRVAVPERAVSLLAPTRALAFGSPGGTIACS